MSAWLVIGLLTCVATVFAQSALDDLLSPDNFDKIYIASDGFDYTDESPAAAFIAKRRTKRTRDSFYSNYIKQRAYEYLMNQQQLYPTLKRVPL
uniref:Uncharacterized protein n=1 Tax=Plectus sambesii TaxID=2011161 RepID=A0A914WH64_9BILA